MRLSMDEVDCLRFLAAGEVSRDDGFVRVPVLRGKGDNERGSSGTVGNGVVMADADNDLDMDCANGSDLLLPRPVGDVRISMPIDLQRFVDNLRGIGGLKASLSPPALLPVSNVEVLEGGANSTLITGGVI